MSCACQCAPDVSVATAPMACAVVVCIATRVQFCVRLESFITIRLSVMVISTWTPVSCLQFYYSMHTNAQILIFLPYRPIRSATRYSACSLMSPRSDSSRRCDKPSSDTLLASSHSPHTGAASVSTSLSYHDHNAHFYCLCRPDSIANSSAPQ